MLRTFEGVKDILEIFNYAIQQIQIKDIDLNDKKYQYLFRVDRINILVVEGASYSDACKDKAKKIRDGVYKSDVSKEHTHQGSIHNLCLEEIRSKFLNALH